MFQETNPYMIISHLLYNLAQNKRHIFSIMEINLSDLSIKIQLQIKSIRDGR